MTELEKLLKELDKTEQISKIDPDDPLYSKTRSGMGVAVANAKLKLVDLKKTYVETVMANGVGILISGPDKVIAEFCDMVNQTEEALVVDAEGCYNELAKSVEPMVGASREFTADIASAFGIQLMNMAQEYGEPIGRPFSTKDLKIVPDRAAFVDHIKNTIRYEMGYGLAISHIKRQLEKAALKTRYVGSTVPIILLNVRQEERLIIGQLFGKGKAAIKLNQNDKLNKDFLMETFKNVQKQLKPKQTPDKTQ